MEKNTYSIYYDHIGYTMIEWEMPADLKIDPDLGLENYEAIEWGIEHGIFDLIPIADYDQEGNPLDQDGDQFDDRCLEASLFTDKSDFAEYMIPFYEFRIMEKGQSPYVRSLEEIAKSGPAYR